MTFTEQDAENNGLIKKEVGKEMKSVAAREMPELYAHFERVAESRGRKPEDIIGERVVKALEDEAYAQQLFETEVNLMQLEQNEIRTDDIEFVQELADSLGLNEETSKDPIEELVMKRIKSSAGTPLSGFSESVEQSRDMGELKAYLEDTHDRLDKLEQKMDSPEPDTSGESGGSDDSGKGQSLESVFGSEEEKETALKNKQQDEPAKPEGSSDEDVDVGEGVIADGEEEDSTMDELDPQVQMESSDFAPEAGDVMEVFGSDQMEEDDD